MMKKILFEKAFKKAKSQSGKETKHGLSNYLSDLITDDLKFSINAVTLVRYYDKYLEGNNQKTYNPSSDLLNVISRYLGYENFENFVLKNKKVEEIDANNNSISLDKNREYEKNNFFKNNKITIISGSLIVIIAFIIGSINQQRLMVWDKDHYKEVKIDTDKYSFDQLKIYKEERIKYFQKIEPSCEVKYFDQRGKVKVWYGKNVKGDLEIFSSFGLHPEQEKH